MGRLVLGVAVLALMLTATASGSPQTSLKGSQIALNVGEKYHVGASQLACANNAVEALCGFFGINKPNSIVPGTIVARIRQDTVALSKRLLPGLGKPPSTGPLIDVWSVALPPTLNQPFHPGPAMTAFTAKGSAQPDDFFRPVFDTLQSDLIVRFNASASGAPTLSLSKWDYTQSLVYPSTGEAVLSQTDAQGVKYTDRVGQTVYRASQPAAASNERTLNSLARTLASSSRGMSRYRRTPPYLAHPVVRLETDVRLVNKSVGYDDVVDVCSAGVPKLQKDVRTLAKLGQRLPRKFRKTYFSQLKKVQTSLTKLGRACA